MRVGMSLKDFNVVTDYQYPEVMALRFLELRKRNEMICKYVSESHP